MYHSLGMIEYIFVCAPAYREKWDCQNDEIFEYANIMLLDKDNYPGSILTLTMQNPVPPREIGFLYQDIQPFNDNILKFIHAKPVANGVSIS